MVRERLVSGSTDDKIENGEQSACYGLHNRLVSDVVVGRTFVERR